MPSQFLNDSIFWIEVDKIKPNPYQPRKEFDEAKLNDLADSIRAYGVLQPLMVTRREIVNPDGIFVEYELVSGERRLRASKIAGLREESDRLKLELAIIENLQREDLNPIDRARAFRQLIDEFGFRNVDIAKKIAKSREYVSNTLRILTLPAEMQNALSEGKISEGHTRPLLMLIDRPEEQMTVFKEILYKKLNVREVELIARKIAFDRVRKKDYSTDPTLIAIENHLKESLGTRVHIEKKERGGKIMIDFFSDEDLEGILSYLNKESFKLEPVTSEMTEANSTSAMGVEENKSNVSDLPPSEVPESVKPKSEEADDLYDVKNFSV